MSEPYPELLDAFVSVLNDLVSDGQAYVAVALAHELVRYLYPAEPTLDFVHDDPVPFIESHLSRLSGLGVDHLETFRGYPTAILDRVESEVPVELETSALYQSLWAEMDDEAVLDESQELLQQRLPADVVESQVRGKTVVDIGCGSGRYSLALAAAGAAEVIGIDYEGDSFERASRLATRSNLPVEFMEGDVLDLPVESARYEFVFCNGVIHHTRNIEAGLDEYVRVMRPGGSGFLYIYGSGGIFWESRRRLREVFTRIPALYTAAVFSVMGVPGNRFIFADTWHVPIERHTTRSEIEGWLTDRGLQFQKLVSGRPTDLDWALTQGIPRAEEMWGDGEHRYVVTKPR